MQYGIGRRTWDADVQAPAGWTTIWVHDFTGDEQEPLSFSFRKGEPVVNLWILAQLTPHCGPLVMVSSSEVLPILVTADQQIIYGHEPGPEPLPPAQQGYHQHALALLQRPGQTTTLRQIAIQQLERRLGQVLPAAIRAWYLLAGSYEILEQITMMHAPSIIERDGLDTALRARYAVTGPSAQMLPLVFENQGVWHLATPLDAGDDPPVYRGFQEDSGFEWHPYTDRFSDWIWAWVWDAVGRPRDLCLDLGTLFTETDRAHIATTFQPGPRTPENALVRADLVERYAQGPVRVTISHHQGTMRTEVCADTRAALEAFINGPWVDVPLRARLGSIDEALNKFHYR